MDFSSLSILSTAKAKMAYSQQRQDVLSGNIANIDTPGYKTKDIKKLDFKRMATLAAHRLQMRATDAQHIVPPSAGGPYQVIDRPSSFETNPNENKATVEEEMMKVAQNQMEYQFVTSIYKKTVDLFRLAIGKSSS